MSNRFHEYRSPLTQSFEHAVEYLESLNERPVDKCVTSQELRKAIGGALPTTPTDPSAVIDEMVKSVDAGLIATGGPRFFGYAIGSSFPASLAADWLVSAWDQNVPYYVASPALSVVEETVPLNG